MKVVIAGGSGFVGRAVVSRILAEKHEAVVLSRQPSVGTFPGERQPSVVQWDGVSLGPWCDALEGVDALINLCGAGIAAQRWTGAYKKVLRETRLSPTRVLARAISSCRNPPRVWVNSSAVGFYGDVADAKLNDSSARGQGFLADLCQDWETAAQNVSRKDVRVVLLRMGVVLGHGGALEKFILPFKLFVGGPLGSGRQWLSWITREDLASALLFIISNENLRGPLNAVAPQPVTMKDFCRLLGSSLHRPSWARCPAFIVRMVLGEMADVMLFSQRVLPKKLINAGFRFQYPALDGALKAALS